MVIEIDGSYGEGGGQVIRTAITLSCITNQPFRIINIRKNRKQSGLKAQHLTGVNAAAHICNANVSGNKIGSTELTFIPGKHEHGKFQFNIETAGSITLVLQTLVPIALFGKDCSTFEIIGGTDVKFAPTIDYFMHVFSANLLRIGAKVWTEEVSRGFFPKGGGKVRIVVYPWKERKSFKNTTTGKLEKIDVHSICSEDLSNARVAERQIKGFKQTLDSELKKLISEEKAIYEPSLSTGSGIHTHAHFKSSRLGVCGVGELGLRAEKVGEICAKQLIDEINSSATIDHRMADQLILFLAFTGGKFKTSRISNHLKTNAWVIQQFLPNVKININEKNNIVEIKNN